VRAEECYSQIRSRYSVRTVINSLELERERVTLVEARERGGAELSSTRAPLWWWGYRW